MKIAFISDTHLQHQNIILPKGDIIIHSGDATWTGNVRELKAFSEWFRKLDYKVRIFVAGNHDIMLETHKDLAESFLDPDILYLRNELVYINKTNFEVDILTPESKMFLEFNHVDFIKIWGSPITPSFGFGWAFNKDRGPNIKKYWDMIPENLDILITHGPPWLHGDKLENGEHVGCKDLAEAIRIKKPKFHVYGHVHCGYGIDKDENTTYINASICTEEYKPTNSPIVFDL